METPQNKATQVVLEPHPNQVTAYATLAAISASSEEIAIVFGDRISLEDPLRGTIIAKIYMNPSHAKRLLRTLAGIIQMYEQFFGEINADLISQVPHDIRTGLSLEDKNEQGTS